MGQQQLLLLTMGIVIAALAVITGIVAFQEKMKQSEMNHIIDRNLHIASSAAFWKTKRDPFAGGNASYEGLGENGLARLNLEPETHHAIYEITDATRTRVIITGVSTRFPDIGARTYVTQYSVDSTEVSFIGEFEIED